MITDALRPLPYLSLCSRKMFLYWKLLKRKEPKLISGPFIFPKSSQNTKSLIKYSSEDHVFNLSGKHNVSLWSADSSNEQILLLPWFLDATYQMSERNDMKRTETSRYSPVEVGAASHCVVCEMLLALLVPEVLQRVGPQQVTHRSVRRRLFESV